MPRKKQPNNVVKLDLVKTKIQPEFDFSFIFDGDDFWFNGFGLRNGQELQFKYVEEFFDGDFVALCIKSSYFFGFGYSLNNSILLGMNSYTPYPRKDIESIGKLVKVSHSVEAELLSLRRDSIYAGFRRVLPAESKL